MKTFSFSFQSTMLKSQLLVLVQIQFKENKNTNSDQFEKYLEGVRRFDEQSITYHQWSPILCTKWVDHVFFLRGTAVLEKRFKQ